MNVDKKTRLELNALSKEVFGTSSRWTKLIDQGYDEILTEEVVESTPSEVEGEAPTETKTQVPVALATNSYKFTRKRLTLENIKEYMLEQKKRTEEIMAQIQKLHAEEFARRQKAEEEKKAKEQAQELTDKFAGSAAV
jgi:DNA replication protein DnaC